MSKWLTPELISKQRGIPESTLRSWKCQGYIASSTIDNVVMLDDDSIERYLNLHKIKGLNENVLERIIQEKEMEREMILSQLDDELFVLKTQSLYQPLFHILIQELGQLIADERLREIFLAISFREPISRVAARYGMTYERTTVTYQTILDKLSKNMSRISNFCNHESNSLFNRYDADKIIKMSLYDILQFHAFYILNKEIKVSTVHGLLKYTSKNGWNSLMKLYGMGKVTYSRMIKSLQDAGLVIVDEEDNVQLSPELAALVI